MFQVLPSFADMVLNFCISPTEAKSIAGSSLIRGRQRSYRVELVKRMNRMTTRSVLRTHEPIMAEGNQSCVGVWGHAGASGIIVMVHFLLNFHDL